MIGIFGANGFIGRALAERLSLQNQLYRTISRGEDLKRADGHLDAVQHVRADLRDIDDMRSCLDGIETVVQLIGATSPGTGNSRLENDVELEAIPHIRFIELCAEMGVKRYVFLSSGGTVYGNAPYRPIPETAPTNPISSHGAVKLMIEKYLHIICMDRDMEYAVLRLSNPYGPGQLVKRGQGIVPALLHCHRHDIPFNIIGDGSSVRDYIFIDDAISALVKLLGEERRGSAVFNLGSGEGVDLETVVSTVGRLLNYDFKKTYLPQRSSYVLENVLDISKIKQELSWAPQVSFEEGMRATIQEAA